MTINEELNKAKEYITDPFKRIVFITGKAGTGKSTFLRELKKEYESKAVVLSPTGLSALNINGETIHSFFGLPIGILPFNGDELRDIKIYPNKKTLIENLEMIIIDEVSMIRADTMDAIDYVLRRYKGNDIAFGGVKMIMFGDLYQLEPVVSSEIPPDYFNGTVYQSPFFFSSVVISKSKMDICVLNTIYRQSDSKFINILNEIRTGNPTSETLREINKSVEYNSTKKYDYVIISTVNKEVDVHNSYKLSLIESTSKTYKGFLQGNFSANKLPSPMELTLKVGAKVVATKNTDKFVNGEIGTVVRLREKCAVVHFTDRDVEVDVTTETWDKKFYNYDKQTGRVIESVAASYTQIPLSLAWALTVHKSQGVTLDNCIVNVGGRVFAHGMLYVALSRCRTMEGMKLESAITIRDCIVNRHVYEFCQKHNI